MVQLVQNDEVVYDRVLSAIAARNKKNDSAATEIEDPRVMKDAKKLCDQAFGNKPRMSTINSVLVMPTVNAVLQPLIGYRVPIPMFRSQLLYGYLSDYIHEGDLQRIFLGSDDPCSLFFHELARLLEIDVDVYQVEDALEGETLERASRGSDKARSTSDDIASEETSSTK